MEITIKYEDIYSKKSGLAKTIVEIKELNIESELLISFRDIYNICKMQDQRVLELFLIASICYSVDKLVQRTTGYDNWTRELSLNIPVKKPEVWKNNATELSKTLGFLSGDLWTFNFVNLEIDLFRKPKWRVCKNKYRIKQTPNAVCLFSGGLDSLVGAINLLTKDKKTHLILVGHYDSSGAKAAQERLASSILNKYEKRAIPLHIRVTDKTPANESTLRSRSFLFLALGIYIAHSYGEKIPLYAPENGLIALNIPLTPSRIGSCSTRTMHPHYLKLFQGLLVNLGIQNKIINPFEFQTKGKFIKECLDYKLLETIYADSISCSHPTRGRYWVRKNRDEVKNCGYCVPCLIRRAALNKAGLDNGLQYGFDICNNEIDLNEKDIKTPNDLRALLSFLSKNYGKIELKRLLLQTTDINDLDKYVDTAFSGYNELSDFFNEKGDDKIRQAIKKKAGL